TPQPPPTTVPQGNGLDAFGSQGSVFFGWDGAGDLVWLPPGVNLTVDRGSRATWSANTSDVRALQAPGSDSRKAAALYDGSFVQLHLEFTSGWTGYLHLYGVDWDSTARRQTIIVNDGKRQLSVPLDSSF